ncbi:hypothetical protein H8E77_25430 [bacterium]|nr:hypothetical protein [bacterium]
MEGWKDGRDTTSNHPPIHPSIRSCSTLLLIIDLTAYYCAVKFVLTMDARLPVGEIPAKARRPGFFLKVEILLLLLRMASYQDLFNNALLHYVCIR